MGNEISKQNDTLIATLIALDVLNEYDFDRENGAKRKRGNEHRDRERVVNFIDSWTDEMFRRQFRLKRETFNELLQKIETQFPISEKSQRMAINSSGSFISNKLRLCVCLRMLAGASYLDMIWYGVNVDHVTEYFLDMVKKIDIVIDNIKLPETKAEIELTAKAWADIQNKKHHGFNPMLLFGFSKLFDHSNISLCIKNFFESA